MSDPVLDLPMGRNDAEASTVREYLKILLWTVWTEGERFSGKRPFGNGGWERELHTPLIVAGLVEGEVNEYGEIVKCNKELAYVLIANAIRRLT